MAKAKWGEERHMDPLPVKTHRHNPESGLEVLVNGFAAEYNLDVLQVGKAFTLEFCRAFEEELSHFSPREFTKIRWYILNAWLSGYRGWMVRSE
jgi:hypothetical protein